MIRRMDGRPQREREREREREKREREKEECVGSSLQLFS